MSSHACARSVNKLARAQNALLFNVKALSDQVQSLRARSGDGEHDDAPLERTRRGASFTSLFASDRQTNPDRPKDHPDGPPRRRQ